MAKVEALAYVVVQSTDAAQWRSYGEQVLGMSAVERPGGGLGLKMDGRDCRIFVQPGATDCYLVSGWEAADAAAFAAAIAALEAAGVAVTRADDSQAAARQMTAVASFKDPSGNSHEIAHGYTGGSTGFVSPIGVSGFVTGVQGLGHTVLPALAMDDTLKFFHEVLGFGLSDEFDFQPAPDAPVMRLRFMHCNGRHHSLALAEMPQPAGCVHLMVEVPSMTEVGLCYDRRAAQDIKLMATLGQHENDHMTSFYMMTPGGFPLEYGWGGRDVDPASHQTTRTEQVSIWGHDFSVGFQ